MTEKANTPNWKKIKAEYVKGGISQQKLADKYDVSYSTLHRRAVLEKWSESRNECVKKADQKLAEKLADSEADKMAQMASAFDDFGICAMRHIAQTLSALSQDGNVTKVSQELGNTTYVKDLSELVRNAAMLGKSFGLDAESKREQEKIRMANGNPEQHTSKIIYHDNGDIEVRD